jgi:hypothetical protein
VALSFSRADNLTLSTAHGRHGAAKDEAYPARARSGKAKGSPNNLGGVRKLINTNGKHGKRVARGKAARGTEAAALAKVARNRCPSPRPAALPSPLPPSLSPARPPFPPPSPSLPGAPHWPGRRRWLCKYSGSSPPSALPRTHRLHHVLLRADTPLLPAAPAAPTSRSTPRRQRASSPSSRSAATLPLPLPESLLFFDATELCVEGCVRG